MPLVKTNTPGTGNSKTRLPEKIMIDLNNKEINIKQISDFLGFIKTKDVKVNVSNRNTSNTWGSACPYRKYINLYRHSVWVFLHELAHIISPPKKVNGRRDIHGQDFGNALRNLVNQWSQFVGNQ